MSKKAKKQATKKPATKKSTALAPRPKLQLQVTAPQPELLPVERDYNNVLGNAPALGMLGIVEVKLTAEEEAVLSEPVNREGVLVKPTGQPYLPHAQYRKWFDRAFGRLGWTLVPKANPIKTQLPPTKRDLDEGKASTRHIVLVPYMLHIHGQPVAFAYGEQEFNETNSEQTYGDAVEATSSSAIRRLAKQIGVGLELWDRDWLRDWIDTYCVAVQVRRGNYTNTMWRRKVDPPFDNEVVSRSRRDASDEVVDADVRPAPAQRPSAGSDNREGEKITQPQRQRLATIARKAGRNDAEVALWLKKKWNVSSSRDLTRGVYDQVCRELEAKGDLVIPGDGGVDNV